MQQVIDGMQTLWHALSNAPPVGSALHPAASPPVPWWRLIFDVFFLMMVVVETAMLVFAAFRCDAIWKMLIKAFGWWVAVCVAIGFVSYDLDTLCYHRMLWNLEPEDVMSVTIGDVVLEGNTDVEEVLDALDGCRWVTAHSKPQSPVEFRIVLTSGRDHNMQVGSYTNGAGVILIQKVFELHVRRTYCAELGNLVESYRQRPR